VTVISRCPITGTEVFPDLATLRDDGRSIVICPACGREHEWTAGSATLIDVSPEQPAVNPGNPDEPVR
jgi:hypothetical protein